MWHETATGVALYYFTDWKLKIVILFGAVVDIPFIFTVYRDGKLLGILVPLTINSGKYRDMADDYTLIFSHLSNIHIFYSF
jgi:hypothetical protein